MESDGGGGVLGVVLFDVVEDGEDFIEGGGVDHGDAELLEVAEAFEVATVVLAHLEHGGVLAFEVDGGKEVLAADADTLGDGDGAFLFATEEALGLLEDPGIAYGPAAYEDAIYAIAGAGFQGLLGGDDVTVAEDGYVHTGVVLHLTDEGPVGGALIHLGFGAAVDAEGGDADVLKAFGEFDDGFVVSVVAEAGLDGDGQMGVFY